MSYNLNYTRSGEIIEIVIKDGNGRKIDKYKGTIKEFNKFVGMIRRKYGLNYQPEIKDLDWL
jgi:hypothetical protein